MREYTQQPAELPPNDIPAIDFRSPLDYGNFVEPQPPAAENTEQLANPTLFRRLGDMAMRGVEGLREYRDNHPIVATIAETVFDTVASRAADAVGRRFNADPTIPADHAATTMGFIGAGREHISNRAEANSSNRGIGHPILAATVKYGLNYAAKKAFAKSSQR